MRQLRVTRTAFLLLLLFGLAHPAPVRADDGLGDPKGAVKEAIDAAAKRDQAALTRIAESDEHDPWFTAHELCLRGELKAARALAAATKSRALSPLKRYIGDLARRRPPPTDTWKLHQQANTLGAAAKWFDLDKLVDANPIDLAVRDLARVNLKRMHAFALAQLDRDAEAAEAYWAAGEAAEKIGWWRGAVMSYDACSTSAQAIRDFQRIIDCKRQAYTIYGRIGNRELAANMLADLGSTHAMLSDYPQAIEHFEPVLEEYADVLPISSQSIIRANLGLAFLRMGQYAESESTLQRARTDLSDPLYVKALPVHSADLLAFADSILGMLRTEIGDAEEAERLLKGVLAHHEQREDVRGQADAHGALAELAESQGAYEEALGSYQEALDLFEEAESRIFAARARLGIATVLRKQGKFKKAVRELKKILREKDDLKDAEALCLVHAELALAYRAQGDPQRALAHREENLTLSREAASVKLEAQALAEMGRLYLDRNDYTSALQHLRDAEGIIGLIFDRLAPGQAARARENVADIYDVGLATAVAQHEATPADADVATRKANLEEVFFWMEGGRAGALLVALEGRASIREVTIDGELREAEDKARTEEAIARQQFLHAQDKARRKAVRAAKKELEEKRRSLKEAIERIQLEAGLAADLLHPSSRTLAEVQALLAEGEALVVYGSHGEKTRVAAAIVVSKDAARMVGLGPVAEIDQVCESVRTAMVDRTDYSAVEALRAKVHTPLALGTEIKRVLLSPAGAISKQPPGLLFPDREVVCVPSGSTYARLVQVPKVPAGGVLAIADPVYGAAPGHWPEECAAVRGGKLVPLPGTRKEAEAITSNHLLGKEATEAGLRKAIDDAHEKKSRLRALHIACHGLVDDERPGYTALALTRTKEDNGLLTVLDISQLRIPADLVVLSACESGLGQKYSAEGIMSLSRAFMVAGAPRILVSLWKVDDEATRELMTQFYAHWNAKDPAKRVSAAEALRKAQAHVKAQEKWKHPQYWAAWQLWGPPN